MEQRVKFWSAGIWRTKMHGKETKLFVIKDFVIHAPGELAPPQTSLNSQ